MTAYRNWTVQACRRWVFVHPATVALALWGCGGNGLQGVEPQLPLARAPSALQAQYAVEGCHDQRGQALPDDEGRWNLYREGNQLWLVNQNAGLFPLRLKTPVLPGAAPVFQMVAGGRLLELRLPITDGEHGELSLASVWEERPPYQARHEGFARPVKVVKHCALAKVASHDSLASQTASTAKESPVDTQPVAGAEPGEGARPF